MCLKFNILNQDFDILGTLNIARVIPGIISTSKYLWVFGGMDEQRKKSDSMERIDLRYEGGFEEITLRNQSLLKQYGFI